jgi:signal transduction histidine kinase
VATDLQPGVATRVDRDQLTQVLLNLIKNAEEAVKDRGAIQLRVRAINQSAILEVQDSGPGVRPEDRERIFEPYFTTKAAGTGLGLAIARRICQEHGGRLEVDGVSEGGAVFRVVLPLEVKSTLGQVVCA